MAEEKFLSDANIDGKVIVNVVPNNTGTIMTYNPTTKTLSTRTNAQIISDLGLVTNSQLGNYVPLTGTNQFTGLLSDPNGNFRFGTDGSYKSLIRLDESNNPDFPGQTASFYYNIEEGFGISLSTNNSYNQLNLQPQGLFVLTSDTLSGGSQLFHDGTGLYNSVAKQPLNNNYYIQAGYANDSFIKKTVLNARSISDANDAQGTDFYYLNGSNKPVGSTDGVLQSFSYDNNLWYTQMYSDWRTNEWYVRVKSSGNWGSWQKLYHDGNFNPQGFVPQTRNITINGVTQDLSTDRTWNVATYTAGAGLTLSGNQFSLPVVQGTGGNAVTSVTQTANGIQIDKANFVLLTALYNILANYVDKQNINGVIPDEWQLVPNSLTAGSFIKFLGDGYGYPTIGWRDSNMIFTDEGAIDLNQYGIRQNDAGYSNAFNGNTQFQYVEFNLPQGNQPFHVASNTMIQNLNADMLDGYHASDFILNSQLGKYSPYIDARAIPPNALGVERFQYGFGSFGNDNNAPWSDWIHFGGFINSTGGRQNLIAFNKSDFGMRQFQGTSQSASQYTDFVEYWHTGNLNPSIYVPTSRTLTINGTTFDLSANRTWNIPTGSTYTAGAGLTLTGTTFSLPVTISGTGNGVASVTQNATGITVTQTDFALSSQLTNFVTVTGVGQTITSPKTFNTDVTITGNLQGNGLLSNGSQSNNEVWTTDGGYRDLTEIVRPDGQWRLDIDGNTTAIDLRPYHDLGVVIYEGGGVEETTVLLPRITRHGQEAQIINRGSASIFVNKVGNATISRMNVDPGNTYRYVFTLDSNIGDITDDREGFGTWFHIATEKYTEL